MPAPSAPADVSKGTIYFDILPSDGSDPEKYVATATLFGLAGYNGAFTYLAGDAVTYLGVKKVHRELSNAAGRFIFDDLPGNDRIVPAGSYWLIQQSASKVEKAIELAAQQVINAKDVVDDDFPTGGSFTPPRLFFTSSIVRVATTANITITTALNNGDTLDGVTLATGDRVLVKDQSSQATNGVYVVGATPARSTDFDAWDEFPGATVDVTAGSVNAGSLWRCAATSGGTLGTTSITFASLLGGNYQPLDSTLTAFSTLTIAANSLTIGTGADAFAQTTFAVNTFPARASTGNLVAKTIADFALTILDDADAPTVRATIGAGTGDALTANPLSQFASTTSLQLKGVISDETGSGALVFGTSPTIAGPTFTGTITLPGGGTIVLDGNGEQLLTVNASGLDTLILQNTNTGGYSSVRLKGANNYQHLTPGVGNSLSSAPFAGTPYVEVWDSRTTAGTPEDGFILVQTSARSGHVYTQTRFQVAADLGEISWNTWLGVGVAGKGTYTALTNATGTALALQNDTTGVSQLWLGSGTSTVYFAKLGTATLTADRAPILPDASGTLVVGVTTANGVSASNTAGSLTFTLGAITPSTVNGNTITTGTGTLTIAAAKVATVSNTLTLAGTDGSTLNVSTGGTLGTAAFVDVSYGGNGSADTNKVARFGTGGILSCTLGLAIRGSGATAGSLSLYNAANDGGRNVLSSVATAATIRSNPMPDVDGTVLTTGNLSDINVSSVGSGTLAAARGGTGVSNAGTLTNASNTTITGGGTIALGGFTATIPATDTVAMLGQANTYTGANSNSKSGAASVSAMTFSGVPFAGTGTTSFPLVYINDANATASTTLNTAGAYLGVNGDGTQDLLRLMKDGVKMFNVDSTGAVYAGVSMLTNANTGADQFGNLSIGSTSYQIVWSSATRVKCPSDGVLTFSNNGSTGFTRLNLGGTTSSFAALQVSATTMTSGLADGTAGGAFVASGTFAVTSTSGFTGAITVTGGIVGVITVSDATAGNVGQIISSAVPVGSPVSLTTATAANITSISLTAGDWDVDGNVNFTETVATVSARASGINSTSATLPTDGTEGYCGVQSTLTTETNTITLPRKRINVSSTTTIYLVGRAVFAAGTCDGFGSLSARRVR